MLTNHAIPRSPVRTADEKNSVRQQIQRDIDAFLAKGGKIVVYPPGFSADDALNPKTGWEKELRNDPEKR
jgi:ABC-type uncharacterized transport system involved in gliding motility auxiliary subunit